MIPHNIAIGILVAIFSVLLFYRERWFLEKTLKGQRLVRWFGPESAIWVLRGCAVVGLIFGVLLAVGIIKPVQW